MSFRVKLAQMVYLVLIAVWIPIMGTLMYLFEGKEGWKVVLDMAVEGMPE